MCWFSLSSVSTQFTGAMRVYLCLENYLQNHDFIYAKETLDDRWYWLKGLHVITENERENAKLIAAQLWLFLCLWDLLNGLDANRGVFGKSKKPNIVEITLVSYFLVISNTLKSIHFLFFPRKNKKQTVRLKAINKMAVAVGIAIYQMIQAFFRGDWRHNKDMTNERKEDENSFQLLK